MPQWCSPFSARADGTPRDARGLGLAADLADLGYSLRRVGGRDRRVGVEVDPLGRPPDLRSVAMSSPSQKNAS
jgi:hypothetical protein